MSKIAVYVDRFGEDLLDQSHPEGQFDGYAVVEVGDRDGWRPRALARLAELGIPAPVEPPPRGGYVSRWEGQWHEAADPAAPWF